MVLVAGAYAHTDTGDKFGIRRHSGCYPVISGWRPRVVAAELDGYSVTDAAQTSTNKCLHGSSISYRSVPPNPSAPKVTGEPGKICSVLYLWPDYEVIVTYEYSVRSGRYLSNCICPVNDPSSSQTSSLPLSNISQPSPHQTPVRPDSSCINTRFLSNDLESVYSAACHPLHLSHKQS